MEKKKVLLINSPLRENQPPSTFPLGFAYIARSLVDAGIGVRVLDIDGFRLSKEELINSTFFFYILPS
jgi:hypothetical protein